MGLIGKNKEDSKMKEDVKKKDFDFENSSVRPMAITVKAVVLNAKGEVLLLKRSKKCLNGGKWDLPGGHIDAGETISEAITREVLEETGLKTTIGAILDAVEFPKDHKAFKSEKRGLRYIAFAEGEEVKIDKAEHSEFKWLSLSEAEEMLEDKGFEEEKKRTIAKAKARMELEKSLNGWHRTLADFDNFKKRTEKANDEFRKFCLENFILELLPVIDNFEMATEHIPEDQQSEGWVVGVMHIKNQLMGVLETNGVTEVPTRVGDDVNELVHEVIKSEGKVKEDGKAKVTKILKKGYQIGERVIRPATVEAE